MTRELQTDAGVRPVRLRTTGATLERRPDGTLYVRPEEPLGPYPNVLTDRLTHWAKTTPEKTCIAQRQSNGAWRTKTYAQVENAVHHIAQALLNRNLTKENPVAILSENDIEHYLLMLAGQHVGIPTAHLSPVYSLVSRDFGKLRHALNLLTPGLVFVPDGERYNRAIESVVNPQTE
ncbi:MAG: AMP-binding protein, partial [Candidatus Acidiferrales bacterium]